MSYEGGMFCFAEPEGEGDPNSGMRFDRIEVTDATGCWQSYAVLLGKLAKGQ